MSGTVGRPHTSGLPDAGDPHHIPPGTGEEVTSKRPAGPGTEVRGAGSSASRGEDDLPKGSDPDPLGGPFPPSRAPGAGRLTGPYTSADELLADLRDSAVAAAGTGPEPVPGTELLGPDLFGIRRPAPPPWFLAGHDYSSLSGEQIVTFFDRLDMVRPAPSADEMSPAALPPAEGWSLVTVRSGEERTAWAPGATVPLPPLPARADMPNVIHSIWLGGPLRDTGKTAVFRDNVAWMSERYDGMARAVVWTDVPRALFERATAEPAASDGPELAEARDMLAWARDHKVVLLNVDEVFNSESPMSLHDFYRAETAKQVGPGYAAASDISGWRS
ncbi:hypothetical protein SFUMM280S_00885 [Streptomyces fumanus]